MVGGNKDKCLRMPKESRKVRFDSYSVRNSVFIISYITFRECRVHFFPTIFLEIAVYKVQLFETRRWSFLILFTPATVVYPKHDVKEMNDQQELEHYEEGSKWLEEAKENFDNWFGGMRTLAQTDQQRRVGNLALYRQFDKVIQGAVSRLL